MSCNTPETEKQPPTQAPQLTRTTFRTSRLLDFLSEKELTAQTGHARAQWPLVVLKELVDNALDACEEANLVPNISVGVSKTGIAVTDNGPGLATETIKGILDFSVRVSSREAYVAPDRGAQGNALKTIVAMPFVLDGKHGKVVICSRGVQHDISLRADHVRQEPVIDHTTKTTAGNNGTTIEVRWPDSARLILTGAEARFLQLADAYTWLNPHLALSINWFGKARSWAATSADWSKWRASEPTSPHWYKPEHLERLIAAYITADALTGRRRTVREFVSEFRGLTGSAKQQRVVEAAELPRAYLTDLCNGDGGFHHELVARLLEAMKAQSRPIQPLALGAIGREHFEQRCRERDAVIESFDYKRMTGESGGLPWVVETAFAYLGDHTEDRGLRLGGVNWSPGILNPFRQLSEGESLDRLLQRRWVDTKDAVIMVVHVAQPRIAFTDRGKSAVDLGNDGEGEAEDDVEEGVD